MFSLKSCALRGLLSAAIVLMSSHALSAQTTYDWSNSAGGLFQAPANWTPAGGPPTGLDTARFNQSDAYTVTFNADRTHQFLLLGDDDVTLNLSGRTYTLTGDYPTLTAGIAPGNNFTLTLQNGTLISNWAVFGTFWAGQGTLIVPGPVTWQNNSAIIIGGAGSVVAEANNGAHVTSQWTTVGDSGTGSGELNMFDAGTMWTCTTSVMSVGNNAEGTLLVSGGAHVSSAWGDIGYGPSGSGVATVVGAGSRWDMGIAAASAGIEGTGLLYVQNGGVVTSQWGEIGREATGHGEVTVAGAGSRWDVNGVLTVGGYGIGQLTIQPGGTVQSRQVLCGRYPGCSGTVTVNGDLNINADGAYLYVGYGGPSSLTLNGNLTITDPGGTVGGDDGYAVVGSQPGATGLLTINSGGSYSSSAQLQLGALAGSHGEVVINTGGTAISRLAASSPSGAAGNVARDGIGIMTIAGGLWNCLDGALNVGFNAGSNGTMTITNGGTALSIGGSIGRSANATGAVLIDGAGSDWTSTATINVGVGGIGSLTVMNSGLAAAPTIQIGSNGTVGGVGSLNGTVANDGTLAPGDVPGPVDIGLLTINGALSQSSAGKTVIDVSGTAIAQRDRIQISGAASLAGTLQVNLVGGFIPSPGQEFQIITAASVAGTFADISGAGSGYLEAIYDATTVKLRYCQPCDANCDGVSNGRDIKAFVNIMLGVSAPCGSCAGDANRDAVVNSADVAAFVQCLTGP